MRAQLPGLDLQAWLVSLAALAAILGFILSFFRGGDDRDPTEWRNIPVSEFRDSTKASFQNLAESLEGTDSSLFDSSVLQSRQRLELFADQVETVARRWTDETFEDVDDAEYEFLHTLRDELNEIESSEVTPAAVDRAFSAVSVAVDVLSAVRTYPIVLGYTPLFVSAGGDGDAVRIEVAGSFLTSGDPRLTIGNVDDGGCERSRADGDTGLVFLCAANLFLAGDAKGFQAGKLRVYREPDFFEGLLGSEPAEYLYGISIKVVPAVMGRARLSMATQRTTSERQYKSQSFSYRNGHCRGSSDQLFPFNVSGGWTIEPSSIEATCDHSSRSSCNGLRNVTDRSFSYSCTIANAGNCGPFWRDGRGSCWGAVRWSEVREDHEQIDVELEAELQWGREERIDLPEGTRSVQIAVDRADENRRTFGTPDTGSFSDPWFDVDVDLEDRYVVIRPVELDVAMRPAPPATE